MVVLSNATLFVPAAEFSFIRSHTGEQPTSFTINLQGADIHSRSRRARRHLLACDRSTPTPLPIKVICDRICNSESSCVDLVCAVARFLHAGDANMRFYNVRDLRADGLFVQRYAGPGLEVGVSVGHSMLQRLRCLLVG